MESQVTELEIMSYYLLIKVIYFSWCLQHPLEGSENHLDNQISVREKISTASRELYCVISTAQLHAKPFRKKQ